MKWDTKASVDFLQNWSLNGPWAVTSIPVDRGGKLDGRLFYPGDEDKLTAFLERAGKDERNIYFSVNPVIPGEFRNKASREGIHYVTHFHVDLDPRAGEELADEQERILKLIESLPTGIPEPTWVIFSGGGYQLYWELSEPIEINGELEAAERAKLYNLQLEVMLKGDNCHNVDRIMRLPGTINVPDKKKIKKGRSKALAHVVKHNPENIYPLAKFTPAAQVNVDTGFGSTIKVEISSNLERAGSIDDIKLWASELGTAIPDWLQILIVQGTDPDDPNKYPSRSEALFACICGLARAKLSDSQIYAIITDPDWGIAASVIDKGSGMERYAKRQIERGREFIKSPELLELNERHAVISVFGGKCVVVQEIWDPTLKRYDLVKQSFGDFKNRYMNRKVSLGSDSQGKEKFAPLGKWWLEHPDRRQYTNIVFSPKGEISDAYNLWRGFAYEALPTGSCDLYLEHMKDVICSGNQTFFEYLLNWMARAVQHPDRAGETAIILRGRQGTGKSVLVKNFGALFGRHFLQVSDPKHLVGSFNQHLRGCIVLFGDEAFFAGDKKHEGVLKTLVTEEFFMAEAKGYDAEATPNYLHLLMASNSDWVIPAGMEERRFFVLDVNETKMQNTSYFKALNDQMINGGREALLHLLKTRDISDFNHRKIPQTEALTEQKQLSMGPEFEWWYDKLVQGSLLPEDRGAWRGAATLNALFQNYAVYLRDLGVYRKQTKTVLGRFLKKVCPGACPHHRLVNWPNEDGTQSKQYVWEFPELSVLREYWDQRYFEGEWPEEVLPHVEGEPF